jgi:hypothetical protein
MAIDKNLLVFVIFRQHSKLAFSCNRAQISETKEFCAISRYLSGHMNIFGGFASLFIG